MTEPSHQRGTETRINHSRILVTGHTGFVGRYVLDTFGGIAFQDENGRIDLCCSTSVDQFVANKDFDFVLHLAAQSHVPTSILSLIHI